MRGAVRLQRPDLHLPKALASELRLATERLLSNQRVGAGGARMDLVLHQVHELQHVDVADGDRLVERFARSAVIQDLLSVDRRREPALEQHLLRQCIQFAILLALDLAQPLLLEPQLEAHARRLPDPAVIEDSGRVMAFALEPLVYLLDVYPLANAIRQAIAAGVVAVRRLD